MRQAQSELADKIQRRLFKPQYVPHGWTVEWERVEDHYWQTTFRLTVSVPEEQIVNQDEIALRTLLAMPFDQIKTLSQTMVVSVMQRLLLRLVIGYDTA